MSLPVRAALLAASLVVCIASNAGAQTQVVVPNANESAEGNNGSKLPFAYPPARFQQLFAAAEFGAIHGPAEITEIAFRGDMGAAAFDTTLGDVQIELSTTAATPQTLASSYADNVGADVTVVHSGALPLSGAGSLVVPMPFDVSIPLSPTFVYDPSAGNLLLDVRVIDASGRAVVPYFDALSLVGGNTRVFCDSLATSCSVDNASGTVDGDLALIARFTFAPEPTSALLGGAALLPLVWLRRRTR